ncbi:hypothetical protein R1flu_001618 [Riccia fluitans]|uniref:Uncharacterized protein n=1 Tax=Riccia fluitans TaxID=41844 RepID=A0ABD1Y3S4_9MARC
MTAIPTNALSVAAITMPEDQTPNAEDVPNLGAQNAPTLQAKADQETEDKSSAARGSAVVSEGNKAADKASIGINQVRYGEGEGQRNLSSSSEDHGSRDPRRIRPAGSSSSASFHLKLDDFGITAR